MYIMKLIRYPPHLSSKLFVYVHVQFMWNDARWCDEQTVDSNVKFVFSDVIRELFLLR